MRTREWTRKALAAGGCLGRVLRIWMTAVFLQGVTVGSALAWGEYPTEMAECGDHESSTGGEEEDGQFGAGTGTGLEPDLPAPSLAMVAAQADASTVAVLQEAPRGFSREPSVCCDLDLIYPME